MCVVPLAVFVRLPLQREVVKHVPGLWGQWFGPQPTSQMARISHSLSSFFSSLFFPCQLLPHLFFSNMLLVNQEMASQKQGCCYVSQSLILAALHIHAAQTHLKKQRLGNVKTPLALFSNCNVFSRIQITCQIMACLLAD